MPALMRQAHIQGTVLVSIYVDRQGKVACVDLIHGHPLMAAASMDAAKQWTFRPMLPRVRPVSFFGHLAFTFSHTSAPASCFAAHW
jgi:TonB family protein